MRNHTLSSDTCHAPPKHTAIISTLSLKHRAQSKTQESRYGFLPLSRQCACVAGPTKLKSVSNTHIPHILLTNKNESLSLLEFPVFC